MGIHALFIEFTLNISQIWGKFNFVLFFQGATDDDISKCIPKLVCISLDKNVIYSCPFNKTTGFDTMIKL